MPKKNKRNRGKFKNEITCETGAAGDNVKPCIVTTAILQQLCLANLEDAAWQNATYGVREHTLPAPTGTVRNATFYRQRLAVQRSQAALRFT